MKAPVVRLALVDPREELWKNDRQWFTEWKERGRSYLLSRLAESFGAETYIYFRNPGQKVEFVVGKDWIFHTPVVLTFQHITAEQKYVIEQWRHNIPQAPRLPGPPPPM